MISAALPLLIDVALAWLGVESLWLVLRGRRIDLLGGQCAGLLLLAGLRLAVGAAAPVWVLLCLAGALPAHLADLHARRARRRDGDGAL